jgi:hypothetical protein
LHFRINKKQIYLVLSRLTGMDHSVKNPRHSAENNPMDGGNYSSYSAENNQPYKEAEITTETTQEITHTTPSLFELKSSELTNPPRSKQKEKQAKENPCDSRHAEIREAIISSYENANGEIPAWEGREAGILSRELKRHSTWTADKFLLCVRNRFLSDVNLGEEPYRWLSRITDYVAGPLNEYGKPKGVKNGKDEELKQRNREIIARTYEKVSRGDAGLNGADISHQLKS